MDSRAYQDTSTFSNYKATVNLTIFNFNIIIKSGSLTLGEHFMYAANQIMSMSVVVYTWFWVGFTIAAYITGYLKNLSWWECVKKIVCSSGFIFIVALQWGYSVLDGTATLIFHLNKVPWQHDPITDLVLAAAVMGLGAYPTSFAAVLLTVCLCKLIGKEVDKVV